MKTCTWKIRFFFLGSFFGIWGNASYANDNFYCPSEIQTDQLLHNKTEGWEDYNRNLKHRLVSVSFFSGHPSQRFSIKYDDIKEEKRREIFMWKLPVNDSYWIQCSYFGTKVTLAKKINTKIAQCEVSYLGNEVEFIRCR